MTLSDLCLSLNKLASTGDSSSILHLLYRIDDQHQAQLEILRQTFHSRPHLPNASTVFAHCPFLFSRISSAILPIFSLTSSPFGPRTSCITASSSARSASGVPART